MTDRYDQPQALRRALEDRLKANARSLTLPLDRLRKEAAFGRLLARLVVAAPEGSWALKGGLAMLARAGAHARTTADADTTWRADAAELQATLERAADLDLGDYFEFLIGQPAAMRGEGPEGGARFPVESRLAGRLFEQLRLDVNFSPDDRRPVERLELRNPFAFAGLPAVVVPAIGAAQQLAEKLHAYTRDYGPHDNSRAKDLYDMLVIAADLSVPDLADLTENCIATFALRDTAWAPQLNPPPAAWDRPWAGFVRDYGITFRTLPDAYAALGAFWRPVIERRNDENFRWDASTWAWVPVRSEIA